MDAGFWHQKWQSNEIGFHGEVPNSLLVDHLAALSLKPGSRLFLPLCGKTLDIAWLRNQGFAVAGAELSKLAIQQLFDELGVEPSITQAGSLKHYSAEGIDIFVGDIFDLCGSMLGPIDAIYDRAALVALPKDMRVRYTAHLMGMTNIAPQLVICYEYDQGLVGGPPFSITAAELTQHYQEAYKLELLASQDVNGGMRGHPAKESIWLLSRP